MFNINWNHNNLADIDWDEHTNNLKNVISSLLAKYVPKFVGKDFCVRITY